VSGSHAYLVEDHLQILDLADPANPQDLSSHETAGSADKIALSGDHAYIADGSSGLCIVDVSDPAAPEDAGSWTDQSIIDVAVVDDNAYLASLSSGLVILDVSDPGSPEAIGSSDTAFSARAVAVSPPYAYTSEWGAGLRVLDVSDPAGIQTVGLVEPINRCSGIAISGSYAYLADYYDGLVVVDISDPTDPQLVASCPVPAAERVAVHDTYAYVAAWQWGLQVVDVSDPSSPQILGYYYTPGHAGDVALFDSRAYVGSGFGGLWILEFVPVGTDEETNDPLPVEHALIRNHPNPFSRYTTIEYSLPWETAASLAIFNSLGQRVAVLFEAESVSRGRHRVLWDGIDESGNGLSPGVYLCRITGEGFSTSRPLVLVR
jgi:hypothetical protein